ncbi:MAG: competence/damage-inducible protein A [Legionellaceae bacterium]|nr:competence/damage-inducible protein A [Legionellaceae bacterium]
MTIAILSTGDELTHGDTLNTTSQVLANALSLAGFPMGMHLICGDKEQELLDAITFLAAHHETVIITGGLGPTSDDRTRFALAKYIDKPLILYTNALAHIKQRLDSVHLTLDAEQEVQALFPEGAQLFNNPNGTAMGCAYKQDNTVFVLLPGPPKECLPMFDKQAFFYLKQTLIPSDKVCLKWRLFGVPEGAAAKKLEAALANMPCQLGYRLDRTATPSYLEFKVRCDKALVEQVQTVIEPLVSAYVYP